VSEQAASKHTATFQLAFDGSVAIDALGFWPDGNAPNRPTSGDAAAVARQYIEDHGLTTFLEDWNLGDAIQVWVSGWQVYP
jgi:hypothetical protein